jgi:FKBP-type peptidyl-prolyl cis-trans isomerase
VHYRGTLASDGSEFDASYNRGSPLSFKVGSGQVIKGWDQGLLDMCPGEKRKLTIQSDWAYGSRGAGPIPANAVLSKLGTGWRASGLSRLTGGSFRDRAGFDRWRQQG